MWICVAIGIVVYGVMTYPIVSHSKAKKHKPATFDDSLTIEILRTVIPILILVAMAIPATSALLDMEDTSNSDMSIKSAATNGGGTTTMSGRMLASLVI